MEQLWLSQAHDEEAFCSFRTFVGSFATPDAALAA